VFPGQQLSAVNSWLAILYFRASRAIKRRAVAFFLALPSMPSNPAAQEEDGAGFRCVAGRAGGFRLSARYRPPVPARNRR